MYGYNLEFAKDVLAEAGRAGMKYNHRLSMHPGQFTQLGSPRGKVVENSVRDIDYHCQLLDFLGLRGQADRDAVITLHMGGIFEGKGATLQRFRKNYSRLSLGAKARLVLENDDVCWSVHDLLPICEELNIPLVLDWHHHNIVRDPSMREGTLDILQLMPRIKETWTIKGITQKQHYSESRKGSVTQQERRRHSARVTDLPPCENTMDLMIEAKDKEQAVFELMKKFKIKGWEKIQGVIPHVRLDENKVEPKKQETKPQRKAAEWVSGLAEIGRGLAELGTEDQPIPKMQLIPEYGVRMGGKTGRIYWPEGREEWLRPQKRVRIKKVETGDEHVVVNSDEVFRVPRHISARSGKRKNEVKAGTIEGSGEEELDSEDSLSQMLPSKKVRRRTKNRLPRLHIS